MPSLLTLKEVEYLKEFKKLLDFGAKIFLNLDLKQSVKNNKRNFAIFYFGAIHNYSEAIFILCNDSRPHASQSLLRSIFEAYINTIYFLNTNSDLKIAKLTISDIEEKIKTLKQFEAFVKKYPHIENRYGLTTKKTLEEIIAYNQNNIDAIKRANKFHKTTKVAPNLRSRAEALDLKNPRKEKGSWEYNYLLLYKYSSDFTHLSVTGLDSFLHEENGVYSFDLGQTKGIEAIIITNYGFYLVLLNYFKKRKYIPINTDLKYFNRKMKGFHKISK